MAVTHTRVGEQNGPVLCPDCEIPNAFERCTKCGRQFSEPWLRSWQEYEAAVEAHSMSGVSIAPLPFLKQLVEERLK